MRLIAILPLAALVFSGCLGGSTGTLAMHVTDAPDNIGDFSSLTVTVDKIVLHGKEAKDSENADDENKTDEKTTFAPASATFDLTKLQSGNVSTIFKDKVPAGTYKKLTLYIRDAKGVLKSTGATVDVKSPSGRLFLNGEFTIANGKETDFLFDINVKIKGNGEYQFEPNASASGPDKKGTGEAASAGKGKSG